MRLHKKIQDWWAKPDRYSNLYDFIIRHIPMLISPSGHYQLIHYFRDGVSLQFDRETQILLQRFSPGSVIVDVGSNTGKFTASFLERDYIVISIDPLPEAIKSQKAQFSNYLDNRKLYLHQVACSNERGWATLFRSSDANGCYSSLEERWAYEIYQDKWEGETLQVEKILLADCVKQYAQLGLAPRAIKIDTEGHEPEVLGGLLKNLDSSLYPEIIVSEFHTHPEDRDILNRVLQILKNAGYRQFRYIIRYWDMILHDSGWLDTNFDVYQWNEAQQFIPAGPRYGNLIALNTAQHQSL